MHIWDKGSSTEQQALLLRELAVLKQAAVPVTKMPSTLFVSTLFAGF